MSRVLASFAFVGVLVLIAFAVPQIHNSASNAPETVRRTLPDGTTEEYTVDSQNRRHGVSREWYPDGTLKRETVHSHGSWQSVKAWWPNGTLQEEHSTGILGDTMRMWDENGKLITP